MSDSKKTLYGNRKISLENDYVPLNEYTDSQTTPMTTKEDNNLKYVIDEIAWHKKLLQRQCIEYGGPVIKPKTMYTNRNHTFRHTALLATGAIRRLNRQLNLHDEDVVFSTEKGGVNIYNARKTCISNSVRLVKFDGCLFNWENLLSRPCVE